ECTERKSSHKVVARSVRSGADSLAIEEYQRVPTAAHVRCPAGPICTVAPIQRRPRPRRVPPGRRGGRFDRNGSARAASSEIPHGHSASERLDLSCAQCGGEEAAVVELPIEPTARLECRPPWAPKNERELLIQRQ